MICVVLIDRNVCSLMCPGYPGYYLSRRSGDDLENEEEETAEEGKDSILTSCGKSFKPALEQFFTSTMQALTEVLLLLIVAPMVEHLFLSTWLFTVGSFWIFLICFSFLLAFLAETAVGGNNADGAVRTLFLMMVVGPALAAWFSCEEIFDYFFRMMMMLMMPSSPSSSFLSSSSSSLFLHNRSFVDRLHCSNSTAHSSRMTSLNDEPFSFFRTAGSSSLQLVACFDCHRHLFDPAKAPVFIGGVGVLMCIAVNIIFCLPVGVGRETPTVAWKTFADIVANIGKNRFSVVVVTKTKTRCRRQEEVQGDDDDDDDDDRGGVFFSSNNNSNSSSSFWEKLLSVFDFCAFDTTSLSRLALVAAVSWVRAAFAMSLLTFFVDDDAFSAAVFVVLSSHLSLPLFAFVRNWIVFLFF